MIEQKYCCCFMQGSKCLALKEYVCEKEECKFYKPKNKYYLDEEGFAWKMEDSQKGMMR